MKSYKKSHKKIYIKNRLFSAFVFVASTLSSVSTFASGYTCLSVDRDTRINIVTKNSESGQTAQAFIVLDPAASKAKRVIATFALIDGLLKTESSELGYRFSARVDTTLPGSSRAGRKVGGTILGALDVISLEIQTITSREPVQVFCDGAMYAAQVVYTKKTGQELKQDFDCRLFLTESIPPETFN